ncbi:hypothetical protein D9611_013327 [Ephemerocybe angulata]|uniref:CFEM domain-containing protein n=1 Tax=Ephemerocybe angulata TaxID=980116 RepID=A0A8H5FJB6_9AGAR|nr:hypothetical protein D9611_013327 [Tulosesus angulatus]
MMHPASVALSLILLCVAPALSLGYTLPPQRRQLPACTDACVQRLGTPEWGCDLADVKCLCLNTAFREAMTACVKEKCEGGDVEASLAAIEALCEEATGPAQAW